MGVLIEIPSMLQIEASRAVLLAAELLGIEPEQFDVEQAAWPMEKAWDYQPPAHPIIPDED